VLFTGDTLFKMGIGRYDFSYSDKDELKKSLENIFKLPVDTVFYSGHGEESTLGEEKELLNLFI
jgi:hydroxyacylglutathione hydrolase